MTRTTKPKPDADPSAIVLAAYRAANRGQYAKADAHLDPTMLRTLERVNATTLAASRRLRRLLNGLSGRDDAQSLRAGGTLAVLQESLEALTTPQPGSPRHRRQLWDQATRSRSLASVEAVIQTVRGARALVHLRLTLRDGTVAYDTEPLVLQRGRWLLG